MVTDKKKPLLFYFWSDLFQEIFFIVFCKFVCFHTNEILTKVWFPFIFLFALVDQWNKQGLPLWTFVTSKLHIPYSKQCVPSSRVPTEKSGLNLSLRWHNPYQNDTYLVMEKSKNGSWKVMELGSQISVGSLSRVFPWQLKSSKPLFGIHVHTSIFSVVGNV